MKKFNSSDIEIALVRHLNPRMNLIVPNVYWGLGFNYEIDLMIVKPSGYAWEIEIKTSISDLKAEKKKRSSAHCSNRIKRLYFAIPENIKEKALPLIPDKAGLFIIRENYKVTLIKAPKINTKARKLNEKEIKKLHELISMRIWNLKEQILNKRKQHEKI